MKHFGVTLEETIKAFKSPLGGPKRDPKIQRINAIGLILISIIALTGGVLLTKEGKSSEGNMLLGAVIGYWLR